MSERLYTEHPDLYDAIQADWDYDRDVSFVVDAFEREGGNGNRLLEVGCGTGEHTRRFVANGFDVIAIDKHAGMLDRAREKCAADFRHMALPDLPAGSFDLIVAIRGVVNHLPPEDLEPALEALADRLAEPGVLVFDNSPLPPDGNEPALDVGATDHGRYARVAQMNSTGDGRLSWDSVVFVSDGECFVNSRHMTPFADEELRAELERNGLAVETFDGFGPDDDRTVFVAVR